MNKKIDVCAAVIIDGDRILITSRPPEQEYSGYWEFPGGKIEPGETPAQCLARELKEELNLEVLVFDQLYFIEHAYPEKTVRLHFIRCLIKPDSPPLEPQEHQQFRWVRRADLKEVHFLPADAPIARFLGLFS